MRYRLSESYNDYKNYITCNFHKFKMTRKPTPMTIDLGTLDNFSNLMGELYGDFDVDDLVLYVNKIYHKGELNVGDVILLPASEDIKEFRNKYKR